MRCADPIISAERMRNEPSVWLHVPGELELLFPLMCSLGDQVHRHKLTCREASSQGHFYCHLVKSRNASFVIDFILQTAVANEHLLFRYYRNFLGGQPELQLLLVIAE